MSLFRTLFGSIVVCVAFSVASCAHLSGPKTPALATIDVTLEDGTVTSLSSLVGKVVILELCASYHGPCLINANMMREACNELCSDKVVFMSMLLDEGEMAQPALRAYRDVIKASQEVVLPGPESWSGRSALGRLGIPRLIIFDRDGDIYEEVAGATISGVALMNRAVALSED